MIQPIKNLFYIRTEKDANRKMILNGTELFFDPDFDKYANAIQYGYIACKPLSIDKGFINDIELNEGDKVYFHHFVAQDENEKYQETSESEVLYHCNYDQMYCVVRDGQIQMLQSYVLIKPVIEPEENCQKNIGGIILYTKSAPEKIKNQGIVTHVPKCAEVFGIKVGDHIIFDKGADYEMEIEGEKYYRMRTSNILAKVDGERLKAYHRTVIIDPIKQELEKNDERLGIVIVQVNELKFQDGIILSLGESTYCDAEVGDRVTYEKAFRIPIEFNGREYFIIHEEKLVLLHTEAA